MSDRIGTSQQTVEEALARRLEAGRGAASPWTEQLNELGAIDRAVYQAIADTPRPDWTAHAAGSRPPRTTRACGSASRQRWPCSAAVVAAGAAFEGVMAIGATSTSVNLGIKPLAQRRRPIRAEPARFGDRYVPMPRSTSFPSGHAASAFAFAYAVSRDLPRLAVRSGCSRRGGHRRLRAGGAEVRT